jgi:macrolide transport system ATP-binding/permease protein
MRTLRAWLRRMAGLLSNERREQEFASELETHLQMHIDDNVRAGMTAAEARRDAILKLGGLETTRQAYRERGTVPLVETLWQDVRFGVRQLRRSPGFTVTAVLMLTLGIAASVAIFAFVDAALLKPLPYPNPATLVDVTESIAVFPRANLSYYDYLDWKRMNHSFRSLDIYAGEGYLLENASSTEPVRGARVSDGFFRTLEVMPLLGRDFYPGEDLPSGPNTVILSYATWQKRYQGRREIIGQAISLSGTPYTVVGVLPQSFVFAPRNDAEFWAPFHAMGECDMRRSCHGLVGVARLKDGVTVQAAQVDMTAIAKQLEIQYPNTNRGQGAIVQLLSAVIVGNVRPVLLVLLGGAGLLLLIACVNVSSLLLVRSESRKREMAVRAALGASPGRLNRQFVTEGILLVAISTVLGLGAAYGASQVLLRLISKDMMLHMPYLSGVGLNLRVLSFAAFIAVLATLIFSLTPILRLSFSEMREGLTEGGRSSAGVLWKRIGANLVVFELAIAMVLLVGAVLLGKSFYRLLHVNLNFVPDHLVTMQVELPETVYMKPDRIVAVRKEISDRVAALPGVVAVSATSLPPTTGNGNTDWIRFEGRPYNGVHNEVNARDVTPNYFSTVKTRLLRGRFFNEDDDLSKPRVAVINESLAKQYFPGEDPIGKRIGNTELAPKSVRTVVGVVEDLRESSLDTDTLPTIYDNAETPEDSDGTYFHLIVRTSGSEGALLPSIVAVVRGVDRGIGVSDESTMLQMINDSQTAYLHRSSAWLVGGFATLALLLGTVGLYGVIAYSVSQRTREIGVRLALGSQRAAVYRLILKEGGRLATMGIACGIACSLGAMSLLRSMLFGVRSWDVATLAVVATVLAVAAMLASYIPAHRAASINPVEALRAE